MINQFKLTAITLALFSSYSFADVSSKIIAYNCYSCHGEQLTNLYQSQAPSKIKLTEMLLAFKYDKKQTTIMNRIAKGYSDSELESVAVFISKKY